MHNLKDLTFVIPVRFDSEDRYKNLRLSLRYLNYHFDTNIIICEEDSKEKGSEFKKYKNCRYEYIYSDKSYFYRTKILNYLYSLCETSIICNYDSDVFLPIDKYIKSYNLILEKKFHIVYPYSGKFYDVPMTFYQTLWDFLDTKNLVNKHKFFHVRNDNSFGGCIFANKEKLIRSGGENEKFIAWGPEDLERYERFNKLEYKITRLDGNIYHMVHFKGKNSNKNNPFFEENNKEYERVLNMNKDQLKEYIRTWRK